MILAGNADTGFQASLDAQTGLAVITHPDIPCLHARVHLDARVLRRLLHGDVPFVFR